MITQILPFKYYRPNILKVALFCVLNKKHTSKISSFLRQDFGLEKQYLLTDALKENYSELNKPSYKIGKYNKFNSQNMKSNFFFEDFTFYKRACSYNEEDNIIFICFKEVNKLLT